MRAPHAREKLAPFRKRAEREERGAAEKKRMKKRKKRHIKAATLSYDLRDDALECHCWFCVGGLGGPRLHALSPVRWPLCGVRLFFFFLGEVDAGGTSNTTRSPPPPILLFWGNRFNSRTN